jgi:predicted regulator of Ras-like GTPase activity (Roadblock/LC7/MglB family)
MDFLEKFKKLEGYIASAIVDASGEVIFKDAGVLADKNIDEALLTFNSLFTKTSEIADDLGFGGADLISIETEKAIILIKCSGRDARVHLHILLALEKEGGNVGLAKLTMNQVMQEVIKSLGI